MSKGFIHEGQRSLWGERRVIGFGSQQFHVVESDRDVVSNLILANHYSGTVCANSRRHFTVVSGGQIVGALQFGAAMNPASGGSVVAGTKFSNFAELNRMWLSDDAGRNSESRAIAYCIKTLRKMEPELRWIQSFADERCGLWGIVYQAANFGYYGSHVATMWELDGAVYHNSLMTRSPLLSPKAAHIQRNRHRAKSLTLRQFRYLYFIDKRWESRCKISRQPYPKHYAAKSLERAE